MAQRDDGGSHARLQDTRHVRLVNLQGAMLSWYRTRSCRKPNARSPSSKPSTWRIGQA